MGRPTTMKSEPISRARAGVVMRTWSSFPASAKRMPGVTVRKPSPQACLTMPASKGEHTTPSRPASRAFCAYLTIVSLMDAPIRSSFCMTSWEVEVSCVTAISRGRVPSGRVRPSKAACIIATVPDAWTLTMSTSSAESTRMAFLTVLGMSWSLRSRKILCPRALMSRTMEGPSA